MARFAFSIVMSLATLIFAAGVAHTADCDCTLSEKIGVSGESYDYFARQACRMKGHPVFRQGSGFLDVFPDSAIERVEVQGGATTLPPQLVRQFLLEGRFDANLRRNRTGSTTAVRVSLKDGSCFQFDVHVDSAAHRISNIDTGAGPLSVPGLPEKCQAIAVPVRPGMTRAQVDLSMHHDLGLHGPFVEERYVVGHSECGPHGESLKVDLAFNPANRPDRGTLVPKESSRDTVSHASPVYMEKEALRH